MTKDGETEGESESEEEFEAELEKRRAELAEVRREMEDQMRVEHETLDKVFGI